MQGVFITGTSTGVGKTYIGVLLAQRLVRNGVKVIPRKPIESGCLKQGDELIPSDAIALMKASAYQGSLSEVCPYRFEPPISPVRAAHLVNKMLTTEQLVNICNKGSEKGFVLVEGAGGFYSPLSEDGLNADLAMALQLPIILVANDELGCLNQVLLNAEAVKMRGLKLAAVILNSVSDQKDERMDNASDLRQSLDCPVYTVPYNASETGHDLPDELIFNLQPAEHADNNTSVIR